MSNNDKLAAPELGAIEVQGMTRQSFMVKGALAAGTVYGLGAVQPFVSQALAQDGDVGILNFALTLEYLETAATVENLGAAAYLGQAPRIQSKTVLASALAIHTVEGRHAALLNSVVGKTIVPDGAFAKPASMDEVLPKVKPFIVG